MARMETTCCISKQKDVDSKPHHVISHKKNSKTSHIVSKIDHVVSKPKKFDKNASWVCYQHDMVGFMWSQNGV